MFKRILKTAVVLTLFLLLVYSLFTKSDYKFTKDNAPSINNNLIKEINISTCDWEWHDKKIFSREHDNLVIQDTSVAKNICLILSKSKAISVSNTRPDNYICFVVVYKNNIKINFNLFENYQKIVFIEYSNRYYTGDELMNYIHKIINT